MPTAYNTSTIGTGKDYSTIAAWVAATSIDCVAAAKGEVGLLDAGVFSERALITGATTNADYFRVLMAASGAECRSTSTGVRITSDNVYNTVYLGETGASIYDIGVTNTSPVGEPKGIQTGAGPCRIVGCYVWGVKGVAGDSMGIWVDGPGDLYLVDTVIHDCVYGLWRYTVSGSPVVYAYNDTALNCSQYGFFCSGTAYYKNLVGYQCAVGAFYGGTRTTCNDGTGLTDADFVDPDNGDAHIPGTSQLATGGTDLSADAAFAFTDDWVKDTWTTWGIGADSFTCTATDITSRALPLAYSESFYPADYSTLAAWEDATDNGAMATGQVLTCSPGTYDDIVVMDAATYTTSQYFRVIRALVPGTVEFRPTTWGGAGVAGLVSAFTIKQEQYSGFYDLTINCGYAPVAGGAAACGIHVYTSSSNQIVGCHVANVWQGSLGNVGIYVSSSSLIYIVNDIVENIGVGSGGYGIRLHNGYNYALNCTVGETPVAYSCQDGTCTAVNSAAYAATTPWGGIWTKTTTWDGNTSEFKAPVSSPGLYETRLGDYRLKKTATALIDQGTDMACSPILPYTDDGRTTNERPTVLSPAWDIGWSEWYPWYEVGAQVFSLY